VLDEATAFADPDSEFAIQQALEALAAGRTLIVVAHRLHTIVDADSIVVVEGGRVRDCGTHEVLLGRDALYARMWADYAQTHELKSRGHERARPEDHV
jgi:ABC-type multidrug transport system fused ATPase/permease subunit